MKPASRKEIRQRPTMKMGKVLPAALPGYPFRGETKLASAGVKFQKGGLGVFFKVKF